jgi:hypothetical protein
MLVGAYPRLEGLMEAIGIINMIALGAALIGYFIIAELGDRRRDRNYENRQRINRLRGEMKQMEENQRLRDEAKEENQRLRDEAKEENQRRINRLTFLLSKVLDKDLDAELRVLAYDEYKSLGGNSWVDGYAKKHLGISA